MLKRIWLFHVIVLIFSLLQPAWGEDVAGSRDHPLVSRMPNFFIDGYTSNFNATSIPLPGEKLETKEGQLTSITYEIEDDRTPPSELQIVRNYIQALTARGAKLIFEGEHGEYGAGKVATIQYVEGGREVWVVVQAYADGQSYRLGVLEIGEMQQEVEEGDLAGQLLNKGQVTVKIKFDTGRSDIRPESEAVLGEIAEMMAAHPSLKLRIEGHTDNQGQPWANLTLSMARAQSVAQALHKRGVQAERLAAAGFGQAQPIADNGTEAGRAENRRVTLVKL
ncbi:MAG: OmpA family protein [Deltaproteobacteria bacterium]|nr:OmpA family protein [Candidatus Anaeroferrophillacea bacterium]